jgi:predicted nucleic acid-binding protein
LESAVVGLILDSSVIVAAERRGHSAVQILEDIRAAQGEIDVGISVVTIAELIHGTYRSKTDNERLRRLGFIEELCRDVPTYPVTLEIGLCCGNAECATLPEDSWAADRLSHLLERFQS